MIILVLTKFNSPQLLNFGKNTKKLNFYGIFGGKMPNKTPTKLSCYTASYTHRKGVCFRQFARVLKKPFLSANQENLHKSEIIFHKEK
jgi:hypothetical protein